MGGYNGAKYALQLLDEVEQSMILTGVKNVNELNRSFEEAENEIRLLIILALLNLNVFAAEGMWEPSQMGNLKKELKNTGSGDADNLTDLFSFPLNAIVSLGGCSASFVSPEGLIATITIVLKGHIYNLTLPKRRICSKPDLLLEENQRKASAPGSSAYVTQSITNVTKAVLRQTENLKDDLDRYNKIESNKKASLKNARQAMR